MAQMIFIERNSNFHYLNKYLQETGKETNRVFVEIHNTSNEYDREIS